VTTRRVPLVVHLPDLTADDAWKLHQVASALLDAIWDRYGDALTDTQLDDHLDPLVDDDEMPW
jgi:hypothetical protein